MRLVVLLTAAGFAWAADNATANWDLRLGLGLYPEMDKATYKQGGLEWSDENWDTNTYGLELGGVRRLGAEIHGGFVGIGGFVRQTSGNDVGYAAKTDITINAFGVMVGGGYSFKPNSKYTLEIGPRILLGLTSAEEKWQGQTAKSDTGFYKAIELSAVNAVNVSDTLQLGLALGVGSWVSSVKYPAVGALPSGDAEYDGVGFYGVLFLGIHK